MVADAYAAAPTLAVTMPNDARITAVEGAVVRIEAAVGKIAEAMEKIARLEERHAETREAAQRQAAFIEKLDDRLDALERAVPENLGKRLNTIERDLPPLIEARGWIIKALLGLFAAVGGTALTVILK